MAVTFYKDLSLDFTPHPVSGDIRPITDDIAVKRALLNLINTKKGSVPFRPNYGSNVVDYLFKNSDVFTQKELERSLYDTITKHEPRVTVLVIDAQFENYGVKIQVDFRIRNRSGIQTLTTTVRRTA
jgi:phage baseplate assembly protein W